MVYDDKNIIKTLAFTGSRNKFPLSQEKWNKNNIRANRTRDMNSGNDAGFSSHIVMYGGGSSGSFMGPPSLLNSFGTGVAACRYSSNKGNTENQLDSVLELGNTKNEVHINWGLDSEQGFNNIVLKMLLSNVVWLRGIFELLFIFLYRMSNSWHS